MRSNSVKAKALFLIVPALIGVLTVIGVLTQHEIEVVEEPKVRLIRYSFTLSNESNQNIEGVTFKAFAPVSETAYQKTEWVRSNDDFDIKKDDIGNQELIFNVPHIPPYGQKVITVSAQLKTWTTPRHLGDQEVEPSIPAEPALLNANHPLVAPVLTHLPEAESNGRRRWAEHANRWVHENLTDVGYVSEDRGPLFALAERQGDCTEFMHAFAALAKAKQIPVLYVAGFRIDSQSAIVKSMDYHNWALFHTEDAWRLADPHAGVFEALQDQYIVFRWGGEHFESGLNKRFSINDPRIVARLN